MNKMLCDIADYRNEKIDCSLINDNNYVTTDNMLQNKGGIVKSSYTPESGNVCLYKKGDVLISNIRPYFKKIWLAEFDGGCSPDVLVFKPKPGISSEYLFSVLSQDLFFKYSTMGAKGSKMPRGDKNHIMNFPVIDISKENEVGNLISNIYKKIKIDSDMIKLIEEKAKKIYDYWFVQFNFIDKDGKMYKEENREFVFSEELNIDIPIGWDVEQIKSNCDVLLGGTPKTEIKEYWEDGNIPWLNSGEISNFPVTKSELKITQLGLDNSATKYMPKGTIVISITGNIRTSILEIDSCANQSVIGVKESKKLKKEYIYPVLTNLINHYTNLSTGNCQSHINKDIIESSYILIPPNDILNAYYELTKDLYNQIFNLSEEIKKLENLCNFITPLLLNGQASM